MSINITIFNPDKQCWNWCQEHHFIHQSNLTIEALSILVIALITLFIYSLYLSFGENLNITHEQRVTTEKIIQLLPEFAMYLIIGFFIWFLWFR